MSFAITVKLLALQGNHCMDNIYRTVTVSSKKPIPTGGRVQCFQVNAAKLELVD